MGAPQAPEGPISICPRGSSRLLGQQARLPVRPRPAQGSQRSAVLDHLSAAVILCCGDSGKPGRRGPWSGVCSDGQAAVCVASRGHLPTGTEHHLMPTSCWIFFLFFSFSFLRLYLFI